VHRQAGEEGVVVGISRHVEDLCAALGDFDPALFSGADCAVLVEQFARAENALGAARARAAVRAGECGEHRARGFAATSDWLANAVGSSTREARAELDTVRAMAACPETNDAVLAGALSLEQASEIVRTADLVPGCEAELLEIARTSSLGVLKDQARARRLASIAPEELHEAQRARREVTHWRDELGMVRFAGALTPVVGIAFVNRLDREADARWRGARREGRDESRAACAADAFVAMVGGGGERRSRSADLVLTCDLGAYRRGHAHEGEQCQVVGGGPVPVSVARELIDDAFLKVVLHDGVEIRTVAHVGRHIPAELRTALELGPLPELDGVACIERGCDRRYGLEWDHVDPVAHGGLTAADNLEPRCRPHHREKTDRDRRAGLLRAPP
jgi:Domain of unknown function (DUF222)/HNH endonuclease